MKLRHRSRHQKFEDAVVDAMEFGPVKRLADQRDLLHHRIVKFELRNPVLYVAKFDLPGINVVLPTLRQIFLRELKVYNIPSSF